MQCLPLFLALLIGSSSILFALLLLLLSGEVAASLFVSLFGGAALYLSVKCPRFFVGD